MDWLSTAFPWIGLIAAAALLVLLFGTDTLRSNPEISRWRDLVWLSWVATAVYLLHNVEEYGIDLLGRTYAFPTTSCAMFGKLPYPDCPVPPLFFVSVNVPMFWFVGPIAALLSRRHPLVGLTLYGVIFINAVGHIVSGLVTGTFYNPGLLTALLLFLPLSVWVAYALFGRNGLSYKALTFLIAWGIVAHAILAISIVPLMRGAIASAKPAVLMQLANAALLLVVPLLAERWRGGIILTARD